LRLRGGREEVLAIALSVGYQDHAAFTRAFKRHFGVTPQDWRAGRGRPPAPPPPEPLSEVRIADLAPGVAVFARHTGPYTGVGAAWGALLAWAGPRGLLGPGTPLIGIGHDDPATTPAERIRYDASHPVPAGTAPGPGLGLRPLPAGLHAVAIHTGPLDGLDRTYAAIAGRWLPDHGWRLREEPCSDLHIDDPRTTSPDRLRTEVRLPVTRLIP
jgi:AraC family transcriptional regulator